MKTIGVRELKKHLSETLREIEETGQSIGVSNRGRIVARLVPTRLEQSSRDDVRATIASIEELIAEITPDLPDTVNVEEIINDIRR